MSALVLSKITKVLLKTHRSLEFMKLSKSTGSSPHPVKGVIAKTKLRVCSNYPKKCQSSEDLLICKYFLCEKCTVGDKNKNKKSHDRKSVHNATLLIKMDLQELASKELFKLLLQNDPSLLPKECTYSKKGKGDKICPYYKGKGCSFKEQRVCVHHDLSYKWQISVSEGKWRDLSNAEEIERAYSVPANDTGPFDINFTLMKSGESPVRRLSTTSSAGNPPHFILTTEWLWYWRNEKNAWIEYSQGGDAKNKPSVDSRTVEKAYLDDKSELQFRTDSNEYILYLKEMYQENISRQTKREVRRRPRFVSAANVKRKLTNSIYEDVPDYWDKQALPTIGHMAILLPKCMDEYQKVESLFKVTMSDCTIHSIRRVQNPSLWKVFQWQKEQMEQRNEGRDVEQRYLFHGTDQSVIEPICDQNIDWRLCGKHGTEYGKGSYFAINASYADKFAKEENGHKMMFMASVLVGEFTKGSTDCVRPPQRKYPPGLYDSCVDNLKNPRFFVIFEKHQIYPEYIIEYSTLDTTKQITTQNTNTYLFTALVLVVILWFCKY